MLFLFLKHYFFWHYTHALSSIANTTLNFRWFFSEFFGISLHLKTFFTPFERLEERAGRTLDFEKIAESFIVTFIMRLVGMILRSLMILLGTLFQILTFIFGAFFLLFWLIAPLCVLFLFFGGLFLLLHF
jgi:hypothetical protein